MLACDCDLGPRPIGHWNCKCKCRKCFILQIYTRTEKSTTQGGVRFTPHAPDSRQRYRYEGHCCYNAISVLALMLTRLAPMLDYLWCP